MWIKQGKGQGFPLPSLYIAGALMLAAPFVSQYLMVCAFLVMCCRLVRYDVPISCGDLACMIPFAQFLRLPGGDSLLVYYVLLMDLVLLVKQPHIRLNGPFWMVMLTCLYTMFRMGQKASAWVFLCAGLLLLYLLFSNREIWDQTQVLYAFSSGVVVCSAYGYFFRSSSAVLRYLYDATVVSDGRFRGLFADPNYYATLLILAMVCLMILRMNGEIQESFYVLALGILIFAGALTASKSFFLMLAFVVTYHMLALFHQKRPIRGTLLLLTLVCLLILLLRGEIPLFHAVLARLGGARTINSLTTGRVRIWKVYWDYVWKHADVFFFGSGLSAPLLISKGTHNAFLEAIYSIGTVGLTLLLGSIGSILTDIRKRVVSGGKLPMMRFLPLLVMAMQYFFLQGIGSILFYVSLYIMYACYIQCSREKEQKGKAGYRGNCQ